MQRRPLVLGAAPLLALALASATPAGAATRRPAPGRTDDNPLAGVAASFVRTGQNQLDAGRYGTAAEHFRKALTFAPGLDAARKGLEQAQAGLARGAAKPAADPAPKPVPKPVSKPVSKPVDRVAAALIRAKVDVRLKCAAGAQLLGQGKQAEAAAQYQAALDAIKPFEKRAEFAAARKEAEAGLRRAHQALLAAKVDQKPITLRPAAKARPAAPAPKPATGPAKPAKTPPPRPAPAQSPPARPPAPRPAAGPKAPVAEPAPAPAPPKTAGRKPSLWPFGETDAQPETELELAIRRSMMTIDRQKVPQTKILVRDDVLGGDGMPSRPRRRVDDTTTQAISPDDFRTAGGEKIIKEIKARLLTKVSVNFENEPFADAIRYIRTIADVNILVDPRIRAQTLPVQDFMVNNMELRYVLNYLLRFQKLDYRIRDGAIFISDAAGLAEEPIPVLHEIGDLTVKIKDFVGEDRWSITEPAFQRMRDLGINHSRDDERELDRTREGKEWATFIRANIAPQTWSIEGAVAQNTIAYRNGKLVVTHTPDVQEKIRQLLNSFRKARAIQVAILGRFIEINEDALEDLSVSWSGRGTDDVFGILDPVGAQYFRMGTAADNTEVAVSPLGHQTTTGATIELGILHQWELSALITAVRKRKTGNILTAPRVTCFNTQQAFMTVTTRRNFVRSYDSDGNPEIGQVNDGIIFQVQPFVSADRRYITLELQPQVNMAGEFQEFPFRRDLDDIIDDDDDDDAAEAVDMIQLPQVTVRQVMTTVSVPDGGTLMIGGLAQATESEGYATVPLLGDLPLIRHLFTSRRSVDARNNLIVLVTAHIIEHGD